MRRRNTIAKRVTTVLLTLILCLEAFPCSAFAEIDVLDEKNYPNTDLELVENTDDLCSVETDQASESTVIQDDIEETLVSDTEDPLIDGSIISSEDVEPIDSWSENMPAGYDTDMTPDGTIGSAEWDEDVFPEGTTINIEEVDDCVSELSHLVLGENIQVCDFIAFDISFLDEAETEKLQPCSNSLVHVELEFASAVPGDRFYLVHQKDNGEYEYIQNAEVFVELLDDGSMQATGVSFDGAAFSIYALLSANSVGRYARRTYNFYADGLLFATQTVTKEDIIADPGIPPVLSEMQEFAGWYRSADESRTPVTINELRNELSEGSISEGEVVNLTAIILNTHTVSYLDEENSLIKTVKVYDGEDFTVSEEYEPKYTGNVFKGWCQGETLYSVGDKISTVSCDQVLKPEVKQTFLLTFDMNLGGGYESSISSITAEEGAELSSYLPDSEIIVRPGYQFVGWFRGIEENGSVNLIGGEVLGGLVAGTETFYAKWEAAQETPFTVRIWKQSIEDDFRFGLTAESPYFDPENDKSAERKSYCYERSFQLFGTTGAEIQNADGFEEAITPEDGFCLAKIEYLDGNGNETNIISADGGNVVDVYYDREIWDLVFEGGEHREYIAADDSDGEENVAQYGTDDEEFFFPVYKLFRPEGEPVTDNAPAEQYGVDNNGNAFPVYYVKTAKRFTPTTSNNGTQYGRESDSTEYFRIYKVDGVWRYKNNSNAAEYNGTRYVDDGPEQHWVKSNSTLGVEYEGRRYLSASYSWFKDILPNSEQYTGNRYKLIINTVSSDAFTGLFGQTFDKYGYTWPSETVWNGNAYFDSFQDAAAFSATTGGTDRSCTLSSETALHENKKVTIIYYGQNQGESYTKLGLSSAFLNNEGDCIISNPFSGTIFSDYLWNNSTDYPGNDAAWLNGSVVETEKISCSNRDSATVLHLRFVPKINTMKFIDPQLSGEQSVIKIIEIPFGGRLSEYREQEPDNMNRDDYVFVGWYLDPQCTVNFSWDGKMDTSDLTVYAGWEKCRYRVVINLCDDAASPAEFSYTRSFLVSASDRIQFSMPTRTGYQCLGIFTDADYENEFPMSVGVSAATPGMDLSYRSSGEYANGLINNEVVVHGAELGSDHVVGKLSLYVRWEKTESVSLQIKYDADGGSDVPDDTTDYYGQEYAAAHSVCKPPDGKVFLCWTYRDVMTGKDVDVYPGHYFPLQQAEKTAMEENGNRIITVTLKAKYVEKQDHEDVTVIFDPNGGAGEYRIKVPANKEFSIPSQEVSGFVREGYILTGWNTEIDGSGEDFPIGESAAANTNGLNCLYAVWNRVITLSFNVNDASIGKVSIAEVNVLEKSDQTVSVTAIAEEHAVFIKWESNEGETVSTVCSLVLTKPDNGWAQACYCAVFETETNVVVFDLNSDDATMNAPTRQQIPYGRTAVRPENPVRKGYRFVGWKRNGTDYDFATPVTGELILTAQWKKEYTVSYSIISAGNGNQMDLILPQDRGFLPGDNVILANTPEPPAGYDSFSGWKTNDAVIQGNEFKMPPQDVSVTGTFSPISYQIEYNLDGGQCHIENPDSFTVESSELKLNNPVKTGYVFTGWQEAYGTETQIDLIIPAGSLGDRVYTATWTPADNTPYTVHVHYPEGWIMPESIDGAVIDTESLTAVYSCTGITDSRVDTKSYLMQSDRRLIYDADNIANKPEGIIEADGSLKLHVYLTYVVYRYRVEYLLKGTEKVVAVQEGEIKPDIEGKAMVSFDLSNAQFEKTYEEYTSRMEVDKIDERMIEENDSVIRVPVMIEVTIDRIENRETYANGMQQYGCSIGKITGTGFTTLSSDECVTVSGLLPGDSLLLDYLPATGTETGVYYAECCGAVFRDLEHEVSYYSMNGFDPETMGKLTIRETFEVTWMNGNSILEIDSYVQPGTIPEYKGEVPLKESDVRYTYSFNGWDPKPEALTRNTVYTALFSRSIRKYTVTWLNYDGSIAYQSELEYGTYPIYGGNSQVKPSDDEYSYAFKKWNPGYVEVSEDAVYRPEFSQTPQKYTVKYMLNGEQIGSILTKAYGDTVTVRDDPIRDGFTFSGWSSDDAQIENRSFTMPAKDVIFFGMLTEITKEPFDKNTLTDNQRATACTNLVYNGENQGLLVAAEELPIGYDRVLYSLDGGMNWTPKIPTAVDAGQYSVVVKYIGDSKHEDFTDEEITVVIQKAEITTFKVTVFEEQCYTGEAQPLLASVSGLPDGLKVKYCVYDADNHVFSDWAEELPSAVMPGTYQVFYRIEGGINYNSVIQTRIDNDNNKNAVIIKADQTAPTQRPAAVIENRNCIMINPAVSGQEYIVVHYGQIPNDTDWNTRSQVVTEDSSTLVFSDLEPAQTYVVFTRKVATDCYNASPSVSGNPITVLKQPQPTPTTEIQVIVTATSITIKPAYSDQEYSLNNGISWVSVSDGENELTFDGLRPNLDYELTTRMAETETEAVSEASVSIKVRTTGGIINTKTVVDDALSDASASGLDQNLAKSLLSAEEQEKVLAGKTETVYLEITDISDAVPITDKTLVVQAAKEKNGGASVILYLDISLKKQLDGESPIFITNIGNNSIEVSVTIPEKYRNKDAGITRSFYLVRVHDSKADVLIPTVTGNKLVFNTGLFSTYSVFYVDQAESALETDEMGIGNVSSAGTAGVSTGTSTPTAAAVTVVGTASDSFISGTGLSDSERTGGLNNTGNTKTSNSYEGYGRGRNEKAETDAADLNDGENKSNSAFVKFRKGSSSEDLSNSACKILIPSIIVILFITRWILKRKKDGDKLWEE